MSSAEFQLNSQAPLMESLLHLPTEETQSDGISDLIYEMLLRLGENPQREGLVKTPERVSRMVGEILAGYQTNLDELVNGAIFTCEHQDMILVRNIQFFSLCEHHLLPFFGKAHVAYIPDGKIIGLSKIPRLVNMYARRLQIQERMTRQIAETLVDILHPCGAAVIVEGAHMCAMMRGVRQIEATLSTTTLLGCFEHDAGLRSDLYGQLNFHSTLSDYPNQEML